MTDSTRTAWDDATWARYGHFAGVVFVVLGLVGNFLPGTPPDRDAPADEIVAFYRDHAGGIKAGAVLFGIALVFGLWWLGSLWRVIGRLEPDGPRLAFIGAVGFVMAGAAAVAAMALFATPALRSDTLAGAGEFAWEASNVMYGLALAFIAAHLLALGALVAWQRFLPVWMAGLAFVAGLACLVGVIAAGSTATALTVVGFIGFLGWLLWVLLAAVLLGIRSVEPAGG